MTVATATSAETPWRLLRRMPSCLVCSCPADPLASTRDDTVLHLWGATDDEWRARADLHERPVCSGAESFLAGTASCRIEVADVDALFDELEPVGVLHDVSRGGVGTTDFGTREFATLDLDGNLLTFFHWETP